MTKPPIIQKPAAVGNYQVGRRQRISRITFHHIVGDAPAALQRFQNTTDGVSATYVIGSDGTIYQCVDENNTPYSDGNADSNNKTISIEHAGGNSSVPYTDKMYAASARLVAYLIDKYGITDFKRHREVIDTSYYPGGTSCSGDLNVEWIIKMAKEQTMSAVNDGDTQNEYRAFFGRDATPEELAKNRDKEWNNPDKSQRAPLYDDMQRQGYYLRNIVDTLRKQNAELRKTSCTLEERAFLDLRKKI